MMEKIRARILKTLYLPCKALALMSLIKLKATPPKTHGAAKSGIATNVKAALEKKEKPKWSKGVTKNNKRGSTPDEPIIDNINAV